MAGCLLWANSRHRPSLFDHLVGGEQKLGWNFEVERLGGFEVDREFKFGRKLDRQVAWLDTLEDTVNEIAGAPEVLRDIDAVANKTASLNMLAIAVDRRYLRRCCQRNDLRHFGKKHGVGKDHNAIDAITLELLEGGRQIRRPACYCLYDPDRRSMQRCLNLAKHNWLVWAVRVHQHAKRV